MEVYDSTRVTLYDSTRVTLYDSTRVTLYDSKRVTLFNESIRVTFIFLITYMIRQESRLQIDLT